VLSAQRLNAQPRAARELDQQTRRAGRSRIRQFPGAQERLQSYRHKGALVRAATETLSFVTPLYGMAAECWRNLTCKKQRVCSVPTQKHLSGGTPPYGLEFPLQSRITLARYLFQTFRIDDGNRPPFIVDETGTLK
jgi:hypothetical protein